MNPISISLFSFPKYSKRDEANGKIDRDFNQNSVNDCGYIAAIYSISQTKEGAQTIEDSLTIIQDDEGDNLEYNVTFKGTGETYTITQEELEKAKVLDENGRQYATGDDDLTIYELAIEKCFKESDDETLKNILKNYTGCIDGDVLNSVSPSAVIYAILGETSETIKKSEVNTETIEGNSLFTDTTINTVDVNGETIEFIEGQRYKPSEKFSNTLCITDVQNNEKIIMDYDDYIDNVFIPNNQSSAEHASKMLDNFEQNPLTNVMTFGTSGDCTIEGIYGNTYEFNSAHAYSIESVEGDKVTLTNASRHDNEKYVISKDSLLALENYWIFGTEKEDSIEAKMDDIVEKDSATYYPNIFSLITDKLFGSKN